MLKKCLAVQCILTVLFSLLILLEINWSLSKDIIFTTIYLGLIILLAVNWGSFFLVNKLLHLTEEDAIRDMERFYILENEKLHERLRNCRHDFINHLQVIYSFLQLKKIDRACEYIGQTRDKIYEVREKNFS